MSRRKPVPVLAHEWELLFVVIGDQKPDYMAGEWVREKYRAQYPILAAMATPTPSGWRTRAEDYYRSDLPAPLQARFGDLPDGHVVYVIGLINNESVVGHSGEVMVYADSDYWIELWPDGEMRTGSRCNSVMIPPDYATRVRAMIDKGVLAVGARTGERTSP